MRLFELSNGQLEAELSAQPQHFRADDGTWQPIDTTVREQAGDGYVLGNDTNGFTSAFGDRTDRLARFGFAGTAVELGIDGAGRSLTPGVDGDTVTYRDAAPSAVRPTGWPRRSSSSPCGC